MFCKSLCTFAVSVHTLVGIRKQSKTPDCCQLNCLETHWKQDPDRPILCLTPNTFPKYKVIFQDVVTYLTCAQSKPTVKHFPPGAICGIISGILLAISVALAFLKQSVVNSARTHGQQFRTEGA